VGRHFSFINPYAGGNDMMTLEQAKNNIDALIANSRMTRQEHVTLQQSLGLLFDGAKEKQEDKKDVEPAGKTE